MIPIGDLSWHAFEAATVGDAYVGDLFELSEAHAPDLFVVHDKALGWSALCIPELVTDIVNRFEIDKSVPAADVGLVDVLRQGQLAVAPDASPALVLALASLHQATVVHVVADDRHPVGLFVPSSFAERLQRTSLVEGGPDKLRGAAADAAQDPQGAIRALDSHFDSFHSELLNQATPELPICSGNGIPHVSTYCPCRIHPHAPCGRRSVARG